MSDQPSAVPTCRVRRRATQDLELLVVENDELVLTFVPAVGGRLISCRFRGSEVLWHDPALLDDDLVASRPRASWPAPDGTMASWTNLGGAKTWPAPQGWDDASQWHGPPDPVLDSGAYDAVVVLDDEGAAVVELTSGADPVTGVQTTRRFRLPATGAAFEQVSTFRNRSERPVAWAVWEVAQVASDPAAGADGVVVVESRPEAVQPLELFALEGAVSRERIGREWRVDSQGAVGKLGFPDATGVLEWRRRDGVVVRLEASRRTGTYPDGGCPVELWLQHPLPEPVPSLAGLAVTAHLVELEVLSPLTTLAPGESCSLTTGWRFGRLDRPQVQSGH